ncbi:hypothetical protein Hanom_Chr04g00349891 [Helianthus anomalus]
MIHHKPKPFTSKWAELPSTYEVRSQKQGLTLRSINYNMFSFLRLFKQINIST